MKHLHILCDLDSTVVDLFGSWLQKYNDLYKQNMTPADVKSFDIHKHVIPECGEKIYDLLDEQFFLDVKPYEGAVEALKELSEHHRIHIVTAFSTDKPYTAAAKTQWVRKNLPFVHKRFITLSSQKHMIHGDVLIDDRPDTAKAVRLTEHGKKMKLMTIAFPFNESAKDLFDVYAQSYLKPAEAWQTIAEKIKELAG